MAASVLCALLTFVPAKSLADQGFDAGSICHISVDSGVSYQVAANDPSSWTCDGGEVDWEAERHIVRHDLSVLKAGEASPSFAEFDRHEFERLRLIAEGADGTELSRDFSFRDLKMGASSLKALVELPDPGSPLKTLIMIEDGGQFPEALIKAELTQTASVPPVAGYLHILAALLCGLLLAPVIFDLVFFKALREAFPLYHALFCLMAVVQTAAVSGLLPMLTRISYESELYITYLSLDVMIAATFLFAYHFIEAGRLQRRYRRWLLVLPVVTLLNGVTTTFRMEWFGLWIDHFYFGVLAGIFLTYFFVLHLAYKQGSRMAPYLVLGIAPLFLILVAQTFNVYTFESWPDFDETWLQNFALLFEVVATALAVADRFMMMRRERDKAINAARDLETLSEHDEMTGLRNRRSLELHYPQLVRDGFCAMAVVDLDDFKAVNDIYGHPVGDRVIRSAAWALSPGDDPDLIAFRMGGEEFLLLLRGEGAEEKAENRRKSVTARIMAGVDEIDRPVTASMGFVDFSALELREAESGFASFYAQVDRLLYEAKCAGRNASRTGKVIDPPALPQFPNKVAA